MGVIKCNEHKNNNMKSYLNLYFYKKSGIRSLGKNKIKVSVVVAKIKPKIGGLSWEL